MQAYIKIKRLMDQRVWDNHIISTDEIAPE
jgi:hypothetical protein